MRKPRTFVPCAAVVIAVAVVVVLPASLIAGPHGLPSPLRTGIPGVSLQPIVRLADAGPMPPLDPIRRFVLPIDPWLPDGFGWDVVGVDDQGAPFCETNRRPTPECDPDGPRGFLHAGFDAAPAPDRVVHASAAGHVVVSLRTTAFVTGRSQGEGGGIVVLEHDRDGDPATVNDRLLTVYGHVDPEVSVGQIVAEGERIGLTSLNRGDHLHFAVRQGAFHPDDLDILRAYLPPPGTDGCAACDGRPLPAPAFPDLWQDPATLFAKPPFWLAIYGGVDDAASDILETDDGLLAFGFTRDQPGTVSYNMAVRRLDREGNLVAQRAYDGSSLETIKHVERAPDGGVIALAMSRDLGGTAIPMLVKLDATAEVQWARQYRLDTTAPGFPGGPMWWQDLAVTPDGGYVVTGTARPNGAPSPSAVVARLDSVGNVLWIKVYQALFAPQGADGKSIASLPDGGFVVAAEYGFIVTPGGIFAKELLAFRLDALGGIVWVTKLGNGLNDARAARIAATPDGGFLVAGSRTVVRQFLPGAIWAVKLNADGTIAWSSLYGSASNHGGLEDAGGALAVTQDGGFVIAARHTDYASDPFGPDTDILLARFDATGEIVGQRRLDSLGERTTPRSLRATSDGFLLAAGTDVDCRDCPFLPGGVTRFVVAHLDASLDCSGDCSAPYDLIRVPAPLPGPPVTLSIGFVNATGTATTLARVETDDRRYPCDHGFFGAPPTFESSSIVPALRTVSCDRTQYIEAYVCTAGIAGIHATSPVILDVTYDALPLTARVVDEDSTPEKNDVVSVTATIPPPFQPPNPHGSMPMLDDGSGAVLPDLPAFPDDVTTCYDDPASGTCTCAPQHVAEFSGDIVPGDSVYTFETSLTFPSQMTPYDVGKGCILEQQHRKLLWFPPGSSVSVILRATDTIGNVASTGATVTPAAASMSCSGDACGCCLLLSVNPTLDCSGLDGMTSPEFPQGVCHLF